MIRNQYNNIASFYDMLSDGDDGVIWFRHNLESSLKALPKKARVLDCSCGTGDHAIWLAKQGFEVHASDISDGMLDAAKDKATGIKQHIHFFQSSWETLPEKTDICFDLVISPGNSFSHLSSLEQLYDAFTAFKKILKSGGFFFFDIRNWEKTFAENTLEDQEFQAEGKDGFYDVRYSYDIPVFNETGQMHVDISPAGEGNFQRYSFDFTPISYRQFHDAAIKAGFASVERGFFPNEDYYFVVCGARDAGCGAR